MIDAVKSFMLANRPSLSRRFYKTVLIGLISPLVVMGFSTIARANVQQIVLSIDGTQTRTFVDLLEQAESAAAETIAQRFQADPNLTEIQVTVLGDRNGQLVSLLSSNISRNQWQAGAHIRQWAQYFAPSSVLLGYSIAVPVSTRVTGQPVSISRLPEPEQSPSQTVEEALRTNRISQDEYWQLVEALD